MELTAANATHHLICRHVCRWTKTYAMRCHILKAMPDGRLKVLVFGDRNWKDRDHMSRVRYVAAGKVKPITGQDNPAPISANSEGEPHADTSAVEWPRTARWQH